MNRLIMVLGIILLVGIGGATGYVVGSEQTTTRTVTRVLTLATTVTSSSSTSSICTNTGGLGCPHFFNQTYTVTVNYAGPWGLTYYGYLGAGESGTLIESGSYYGWTTTKVNITVSATDPYGTTMCADAQKLDGSANTLSITLPQISGGNKTSAPFGTTKLCISNIIA